MRRAVTSRGRVTAETPRPWPKPFRSTTTRYGPCTSPETLQNQSKPLRTSPVRPETWVDPSPLPLRWCCFGPQEGDKKPERSIATICKLKNQLTACAPTPCISMSAFPSFNSRVQQLRRVGFYLYFELWCVQRQQEMWVFGFMAEAGSLVLSLETLVQNCRRIYIYVCAS